MTVAPIPICALLFLALFGERTILSMLLPEILAIGTVFVGIPIVIVLVVAVVYLVAVVVGLMMLFLAYMVLRPGGREHCRWCSKDGRKKKGTAQVSIGAVHVIILLALEFHSGNPNAQEVCISACT
jgi:hypothetical protein